MLTLGIKSLYNYGVSECYWKHLCEKAHVFLYGPQTSVTFQMYWKVFPYFWKVINLGGFFANSNRKKQTKALLLNQWN